MNLREGLAAVVTVEARVAQKIPDSAQNFDHWLMHEIHGKNRIRMWLYG